MNLLRPLLRDRVTIRGADTFFRPTAIDKYSYNSSHGRDVRKQDSCTGRETSKTGEDRSSDMTDTFRRGIPKIHRVISSSTSMKECRSPRVRVRKIDLCPGHGWLNGFHELALRVNTRN